jgi:hypothetical protein
MTRAHFVVVPRLLLVVVVVVVVLLRLVLRRQEGVLSAIENKYEVFVNNLYNIDLN